MKNPSNTRAMLRPTRVGNGTRKSAEQDGKPEGSGSGIGDTLRLSTPVHPAPCQTAQSVTHVSPRKSLRELISRKALAIDTAPTQPPASMTAAQDRCAGGPQCRREPRRE